MEKRERGQEERYGREGEWHRKIKGKSRDKVFYALILERKRHMKSQGGLFGEERPEMKRERKMNC